MAETKIYIPDGLDQKLREQAMRRFGYGRGSISAAAEEALGQWVARMEGIDRRLAMIKERARGDRQVVAVLLFGSYARKEPGFRDVDVAILAEEGAKGFGVLSEYRNLVGADSGIDIALLNDMPLQTKQRVMGEAVVLCVRDAKKLYDYSSDVIIRGSDFRYVYDKVLMG